MQHEFGLLAYSLRWLTGLMLVLGTFNPYGMSYYHWITEDAGMTSAKTMVGIGLFILHIIAILSSFRSLGPIGIGLLTALFASATWMLIDSSLLDIEDPQVFQLVVLVILGTIYGIGLSWSHVRVRLAGQYDSNDVTANSPV